jgi:alkanesulfonate monooxygenase SsuD/methylene tetrahydromethanopterin reductase-like flavin-dependent oxidoreductase (luciferase family)
MRFGLFCSAQASRDDLPPGTGRGFADYLDLNVEAEELDFHSSFLVEHHFTGWNQVSATLMLLTCLAMRTYAGKTGATEEHALCGTPKEVCSKLAALSDAGAECVLLTVLGGKGQLRRFAQEVMPAFSATVV